MPNKERASWGLSGKAAGLYKLLAGRAVVLGSRCGSQSGSAAGAGLRALRRHSGAMAEGDNRSTNLLVSAGAASQGKRAEPLYFWGLDAVALRPRVYNLRRTRPFSPGFQAQATTLVPRASGVASAWRSLVVLTPNIPWGSGEEGG